MLALESVFLRNLWSNGHDLLATLSSLLPARLICGRKMNANPLLPRSYFSPAPAAFDLSDFNNIFHTPLVRWVSDWLMRRAHHRLAARAERTMSERERRVQNARSDKSTSYYFKCYASICILYMNGQRSIKMSEPLALFDTLDCIVRSYEPYLTMKSNYILFVLTAVV